MTKRKLRKNADISPSQSPHDGIHTCSKGCKKPGCNRGLRDTIEEQDAQIEALKQDLKEEAARSRHVRMKTIHFINTIGGQQEELAALRSQFANSEWQPIETAPRNGTDVLCFCVEPKFEGDENPHTEMRVCFFGEMQEDFWCWMGYYGYEQRPTHWMPLPPKPPTK